MKNMTMTRERNRRLRQEFRRELRLRDGRDPAGALREVLKRPLPRGFYIGVDSAIVMDRRRRSGGVPAKGDLRAAMWADLFEQVDRLLASEPGLTRVDAVCRVIATGTSRWGFCMRPERAAKAIRNN